MPALPDTFAALGNSTRFAIVERLLKEGELSAGAIQDVGDYIRPRNVPPYQSAASGRGDQSKN